MKLQLLITLLKSIVSLYCCEAYLFYKSHHNGAYDDIDIYMQATRDSTGAQARSLISHNFSEAFFKHKFPSNYIENMIRDGEYEGRSLGWPSAYSHSEMNRSLVPYGCWFRKRTDTGIYVNLGSSILIEGRGRLYDLLKTPDRTDTYFCSKALQQGYTSIVTNNPSQFLDFGSETIMCYGGCSTVRFNATCPPGIKLQKGYHAFDTCNCSDTVWTLNCDGRTKNHVMRQPEIDILLDKNVCILDTEAIVYPTRVLYANVDLMINIYIAIDLIINSTSNHHHYHNITIDEIISDMKINDDNSNTLLLNLQSNVSTTAEEKSSLSLKKVNSASVLVYTTSMDDHISSIKMIAINNTYIGVISSFKHTIFSAHHRWLLEDARCLKKLGAYLIILVGDFNHEVAEALMSHMHEYVDVIIGVNDDNDEDESKLLTSSYYLHHHYETIKYDNDTTMSPTSINPFELKGRILLFDKTRLRSYHQDQPHNKQIVEHYGKVHLEKTSNYQLMINCTV